MRRSALLAGVLVAASAAAAFVFAARARRPPPSSPAPPERRAASRATQLALGPTSSCVRTENGAGLCWGGPPRTRVAPRLAVEGATGVSLGTFDACATTADGRVRCWRQDGELGPSSGDGDMAGARDVRDAVEVAVGFLHACARKRRGGIQCWGRANNSVIGALRGTKAEGQEAVGPIDVPGSEDAAQLSTKHDTLCALLARGAVRCWGQNPHVPAIPPAVEIAVGDQFACARDEAGGVRCWGRYGFQEDAVPDGEPVVGDAVHIAAGQGHACAIRRDGSVWCWGAGSPRAARVVGVADAVEVAIGEGSACARDRSRRMWCWTGAVPGAMARYVGAFTSRPSIVAGFRDLEALTVGRDETCALVAGGSVRCIPNAPRHAGKAVHEPAELPDARIEEIAEGARYRCLRFEGGAARCATGDATPLDLREAVAHLAVADEHGCVVQRDGAVACWGDNSAGQLGDGTTLDRERPAPLAAPRDVEQVAAGFRHTCAVTRQGTLWCWGDDAFGQLGDGAGATSPAPKRVLDGVAEVALGRFHTCARLGDGSVRCWGANEAGQLGDGTLVDRRDPTPVAGLTGARSLVAEGSRTCAVLGDGTARCWGLSERHSYTCQAPRWNCHLLTSTSAETTPRVLPIQGVAELRLGDHHACARIDGENGVRCWGENHQGQLGVHLPTFTEEVHGGGGDVREEKREEGATNEPQPVRW